MEEKTGLFVSADRLSEYALQTLQKKRAVFAFSFEETSFAPVRVFAFGDIAGILSALKKENVSSLAVIGRISPSSVFKEGIHPSGKEFLAGETRWKGEDLMSGVVSVMERAGIRVLPLTEILRDIIACEKVYTSRKPGEGELADIRTGMSLLERIMDFRAGQAVAVRKGMIVAVEGMEGTDSMIRRAGECCPGFTVVKMAGRKKDGRFDLPAVGPATAQNLAMARAGVLAVEAGKTILLDEEETVSICEKNGIILTGVKG